METTPIKMFNWYADDCGTMMNIATITHTIVFFV
jgi:hypothetical protein